jgi:hypothetical protein
MDSSYTVGIGVRLPMVMCRWLAPSLLLVPLLFWIDPAALLMQTLPFYDEGALRVLRGFEREVYRQLR